MYTKIIITIITIALTVAGYFAVTRVDSFIDMENHKMLNTAVDTCSENYRYITDNKETGVRTEETIKGAYESCMTEKGYR